MSERLLPCTTCNRHVFEKDSACPFCATKKAHHARSGFDMASVDLAVGLAVALSVGIAGAACGGGQTAQPPPNDTTQTTVTLPSGATETNTPTTAPTAAPSSTPTAAPSASAKSKPLHRGGDDPAPIYGGPPPG